VRLLALLLAALPVGHSVDGSRIAPIVLGSPAAVHRVLVVGCIHGNECAGLAIVRRLVRSSAPAGTEIVVVPTLNPDGYRRNTRGNAHGVDLNRNFPSGWTHNEQPGGLEYAGTRPLSEPESRYAVALIRRLRPEVTIWFHQPQAVVRAWGHSEATARRFAALAGVPYSDIAWPSGSASNWQNHAFPGAASFVIELPPGPVPAGKAARYVQAIRRIGAGG
jgi:protein MpaA